MRRVRGRNKLTVQEWRYQAYAQITLREKWLLQKIIRTIGAGTIWKLPSLSKCHSRYWQVTWCGRALLVFLDVVQPYLIAKRKQAILIRQVAVMKAATGNRPISPMHYRRQTAIHERMRLLNMKGVGK